MLLLHQRISGLSAIIHFVTDEGSCDRPRQITTLLLLFGGYERAKNDRSRRRRRRFTACVRRGGVMRGLRRVLLDVVVGRVLLLLPRLRRG